MAHEDLIRRVRELADATWFVSHTGAPDDERRTRVLLHECAATIEHLTSSRDALQAANDALQRRIKEQRRWLAQAAADRQLWMATNGPTIDRPRLWDLLRAERKNRPGLGGEYTMETMRRLLGKAITEIDQLHTKLGRFEDE